MAKDISVSYTEVTFVSGKKKNIRLKLDDQIVQIPVDEDVYAYFSEQFLRQNPTPAQRKRFATVMNVVRAAYLKGKEDA